MKRVMCVSVCTLICLWQRFDILAQAEYIFFLVLNVEISRIIVRSLTCIYVGTSVQSMLVCVCSRFFAFFSISIFPVPRSVSNYSGNEMTVLYIYILAKVSNETSFYA